MMFVVEHIERMQNTNKSADHQEKLPTKVTDETDRENERKENAPRSDERPKPETSTAMQRNKTERHQQKLQTWATAAKINETKITQKKNFRAAATIEAKSKVTEAKNQDTSEIQKLIASKYPIVVLNKLPEQSAAETVNKEKLNEKQFTAISSRTRQKSKLATK